jgi:aspartate aminotransferase
MRTTQLPSLAESLSRLSGEGALDVFRRALELERAGRSIIHLELGAPDVAAPAHVTEAAIRALRDGDARYVAPAGIPELRDTIATDARSRGIDASAEQVIVTPSAKTAVFYALLATVNAGDEVLVPDPGFPIYPSVARFAGATVVGYGMDASNAPDVESIARCLTSRSRVLVLNSPANPSGGALTADANVRLAELVERHDLTLVTDDVYSRLVYEGERAPSVAAIPEAGARTIVVDGFSKTFAMTGYRLGYMVAPSRWVDALTTLAINGHTCVAPFIQRAGVAALTGPQDEVRRQVEAYRLRRDRIVRGLREIPGVDCAMPSGAFYAFPDLSDALSSPALTSARFASMLLEEHGVAAIDGRAFGEQGEGHLRLSFASAQADVDEAVRRIREAVLRIS